LIDCAVRRNDLSAATRASAASGSSLLDIDPEQVFFCHINLLAAMSPQNDEDGTKDRDRRHE
jgi:hypothetical protein